VAGIYIHIPFCKQACHYCDFHFSTNIAVQRQLVDALARELAMQKDYLGAEKISTIYFGGGTPSLLSASEIDQLLTVVKSEFSVDASAEITVEANPDDLIRTKLIGLKKIGVNRLSIGIQSFENTVLQFLNRAHDATSAIQSFRMAREVGFTNISVDLMYAIPGQTLESWKKNVDKAIELNPEHISSYALTIEEKTVFGKWAARKKINAFDNDEAAGQMILLSDMLERFGYEHYEVSNFSKPGFISRHNSSYWTEEKYLGIGPSAHSYNGETRQFNISNNHIYLQTIEARKIPATIEPLTREDKINDYLLTTLRTSWGVNLTRLQNKYQCDLMKLHGDYLQRLIAENHAVLSNEVLILTKSGRLLADRIASDLFQ
jgi:oxygen-independent coproporphyrinogen-3 oxidase